MSDQMTSTAALRELDDVANLPDNYINPYYLDDLKRRVSVARVGDGLYAFDDLCGHDGCPLSAGLLTGTVSMCQCCGSQYDLTTGEVVRGPATKPQATYEVVQQDGKLQVRV